MLEWFFKGILNYGFNEGVFFFGGLNTTSPMA